MKKVLASSLAVIALAASAGPSFAHHSFAMFAMDKSQTIVGTVKEFQWTNPHSWIQVMVPDKSGKTVEWGIETFHPYLLKKAGWSRNSLKAGDKVTLVIHPLKDGSHGGSLDSVTLSDGVKLTVRPPRPADAAAK